MIRTQGNDSTWSPLLGNNRQGLLASEWKEDEKEIVIQEDQDGDPWSTTRGLYTVTR